MKDETQETGKATFVEHTVADAFIPRTDVAGISKGPGTQTGRDAGIFKATCHNNVNTIAALSSEPTASDEVKALGAMVIAHLTAADAIADRFFNNFRDLM